MRKIATLSLSFLMMVITLFTFFSAAPKAQAAEAGSSLSNAIVLKNDTWYIKKWTSGNHNLKCYNKITVPSRGYITFYFKNPYNTVGENASYLLTVYKPDGSLVWEANAVSQEGDHYAYKVGLAAGTYYMNIDPSFSLKANSASVPTRYKYKFTASDSWEVESNATKEKATKISLNKMYSGVYCEQSKNYAYVDYFAVKLTKGVSYRLKFDNYKVMDSKSTMIFDVIDPSGNKLSMKNSKTSDNVTYWDITAQKSGTYYLLLKNSGAEEGISYKIGVYVKTLDVKDLKISLSTSSCVYNGKTRTPSVTVKGNGVTLQKDTHYTVTYPKNRSSVGEYTITINLKHPNYKGKRTVKFTILPATVSTSGMTSATTPTSIRLNWKKVPGATGYKVYQYSTSKDKFVEIASVKEATYKKTSLKPDTKYAFKVKAYTKLKNGTVLYGKASSGFAAKTNIIVKITEQPFNKSVYSGETAYVRVGATGLGLKYKWYYADQGASTFTCASSFTGERYSFAMNSSRDGRRVYCIVTDKYGNSVRSNTVVITMANKPSAAQLGKLTGNWGNAIGVDLSTGRAEYIGWDLRIYKDGETHLFTHEIDTSYPYKLSYYGYEEGLYLYDMIPLSPEAPNLALAYNPEDDSVVVVLNANSGVYFQRI